MDACEEADKPLREGTLLGSYRLGALIADGGMGDVYRAVHRLLPRRAAIKVLRESLRSTRSAHDGLLQEAAILEQLEHPGIARVYDVGVLADGRPWVAMELVEGEPLSELLLRRGELSPSEVVELLLELLPPLAAAHGQGVVHCDLKPENIMLFSEGEKRRCKLIDWGIAQLTDKRPFPATVAAGTPHYMAPEQVRGEAVDGRTDVYALGIIAYEMLTGLPPFDAHTATEVAMAHLERQATPIAERPGLPTALTKLVHAMLAKSRAGRPSLEHARTTLGEISHELGGIDEQEDKIFIDAYVARGSRVRWTPNEQPRDPHAWATPTVHERTTRSLHKPH